MTALAPAPTIPTSSSLASRYARALVMPEVAVRLPAVRVMEYGVTRLPAGRVSGERLYDSEHFFFWMTVIENMPEYTFQRAVSYADPDNVEELAQLAGRLRLESVEPGYWYPRDDDVLALFSKSGEFEGVRVSTRSGESTPEGADCIASMWFPPILLERMSLALLAAAYRNARDDGFAPLNAELAAIVLPVVEKMDKFAGPAVFMPDTEYGLGGLLEARHALRSGHASASASDLATLDDLLATHGERYREYLGGKDAYRLRVQL